MKTDWILTFTSADRPGVVDSIATAVVDHGGNWEESRLAKLCGDFAGIARVSVPQERADSLRTALEDLESKAISVTARPANLAAAQACQAFTLRCDGADHEGITSRVTRFLAGQGINVEEMTTAVKPAPTTGTPFFTLVASIAVPESKNIEELDTELAELGASEGLDISVEAAAN